MCSRGDLLSLLPASVAVLMFAAIAVCYSIAVNLDHLDPILPSIRFQTEKYWKIAKYLKFMFVNNMNFYFLVIAELRIQSDWFLVNF